MDRMIVSLTDAPLAIANVGRTAQTVQMWTGDRPVTGNSFVPTIRPLAVEEKVSVPLRAAKTSCHGPVTVIHFYVRRKDARGLACQTLVRQLVFACFSAGEFARTILPPLLNGGVERSNFLAWLNMR